MGQSVAVPSSARPPDRAAVDDWNKNVLKALSQGQQTDFSQVGEVVIVANAAVGNPSCVVWATQQNEVVGKITMTAAGQRIQRRDRR